jgi:hypothetical protein
MDLIGKLAEVGTDSGDEYDDELDGRFGWQVEKSPDGSPAALVLTFDGDDGTYLRERYELRKVPA